MVVLVNTLHNFMVSAQWNASKRNASNVAIFFGNKKRIEFNDFIKNEPAVFKFAYMTGGGM